MAEEGIEVIVRRRLVRLLVIFSVLLVIALGAIIVMLWNYKYSEEAYRQLREEYVSDETEMVRTDPVQEDEIAGDKKTDSDFKRIRVDFEKLKKLNNDIIGWIYQEDGSISYPVLYSGDDKRYLRRLPDKGYAISGSIFLEGHNSSRFDENHIIIYGHNMRNGTMFGSLKQYRERDYMKKHLYFQLYTQESVRRYRVFGWQVVSADSFVYTVSLEDKEDWLRYTRRLVKNCDYYTGEKINEEDQIMTLSTCTGISNRFVVHGKLITERKTKI